MLASNPPRNNRSELITDDEQSVLHPSRAVKNLAQARITGGGTPRQVLSSESISDR